MVVVPLFFADEVHAKVKSEINKQVDAVVEYESFGLSFFTNFPMLSVNLSEFSIVGKEEFSRDTLAALGELQVAVDVMSVVSGEKIKVKKVVLDRPRIHGKVLYNGKANWDIAKSDSTEEETDTTASSFNLQLSRLEIRDGRVIYDDQSSELYASLEGLNFKGGGNMSADQYDFDTHTLIEKVGLKMDGTSYASDVEFEADVELGIDNANSKYAFKDNKFRFNDLKLGFDGTVAMPNDTDIVMNVTFEALETKFRNILSLVPGVYTAEFADVKTDGALALDGKLDGTLNDRVIPGFEVNLRVNKGSFQYPDLPAPAKNINVDLTARNASGNVAETNVNLKKFHVELEQNPIDASVFVRNIENPHLDGFVKAKVQLEKLSRVVPMDSLDLKGEMNLDAKFKGQYTEEQLPAFDVALDLKYGYVKYAALPAALSNMAVQVNAANETGDLNDTRVDLKNFYAEVGKDKLKASGFVENLDNPNYRLKLNGQLDMASVTAFYPMEGTELTGKLYADVDTEGDMKKIEDEAYEDLQTAGSVRLENFKYADKELAQPVSISEALLEFTNDFLLLRKFDSKIGSSDVKLTGKIENFIAYALKGEMLKGRMSLRSNTFDTNEWMTDEEAPETEEEEEPLEPFEVPHNVDFVFDSKIGKILYDNFTINDFVGTVIVRDEKIRLEEMKFAMLGGKFASSGFYESTNIRRPTFDFNFAVDSLSFKETYNAFSTVQSFAPIAKDISGFFSAEIANFSGALDQEMSPVMETLSCKGMMKIIRARAANFPVMQKLSGALKMNDFNEINFRNTKIQFYIKDGRLHVQPFDVKTGGGKMNVAGSTGLDQSLDYDLNFDLPAPKITQSAASSLSGLTGKNIEASKRVKFKLDLGGTTDDPKITGAGGAAGASAKEQVKDAVKAEVEKKKEEVREKVDEKIDEQKQRLEEEKRKAREEAERRAKEEEERLRKEAEARKKAEEERLRKEAEKRKEEEKKKAKEKLKDKLKW